VHCIMYNNLSVKFGSPNSVFLYTVHTVDTVDFSYLLNLLYS